MNLTLNVFLHCENEQNVATARVTATSLVGLTVGPLIFSSFLFITLEGPVLMTRSLAGDLINRNPPACLYAHLSIIALITWSRIDGK